MQTGLLLNVETGSRGSVIWSYATVCLYLCEISEDKIAVCEKTADLLSGNSSDTDSACLKVLVLEKMFQLSDMHNENRFL